MGRDLHSKIYKGPRIIDLDILTYGDEVYQSHNLTIPHIGISERDFVLVPLMDIAQHYVHPIKQMSIKVKKSNF